jgi:hypothetical protein
MEQGTSYFHSAEEEEEEEAGTVSMNKCTVTNIRVFCH